MRRWRSIALVGAISLCHSAAYSGGISITEMSAKGLGTAFASGGAAAEDASTQWFNPASMTQLERSLMASASLVAPRFDYTDAGSVQAVGPMSLPLLPNAPGRRDGGSSSVVPSIFYNQPAGESLHLGIGVNAPFGLATEYGDSWRGRYQAVRSEITDINLNPALAWTLSEHWSVGAGISINYVEAELTNAVDFAAVCAAAAGGVCPNGAVPGQGQFDGFVRSEGDDFSYGFNLGVLWHTDRTRVGVAYRSEIDHDLDGTTDYQHPGSLGGFTALGPELGGALATQFADSDIRAPLTLPDSAAFSISHKLGRWTAVADITWFDWSDLSEVRIRPDEPGARTLTEPLQWEDTVRVAGGAIMEVSQRWTLRFGAAFDESPVPDARMRSARVPGSDRVWVAAGASYELTEDWTVDAGYAHLFVDDPKIRRESATGNTLIGSFDTAADVFSVQMNLSL